MSIPGAIRFNTDSMKLEYYRGGPVGLGTTTQTGEWVNLTTDSPDIQTGGARGLFGGGYSPGAVNIIDYITISTTGNAIDFGDLTSARYSPASCSSSTRGIWAGGNSIPADSAVIDYVTISSTGNAISFGNLTVARTYPNGLSNQTRGIIAGGGTSNVIDYITIAATGNAVDFGDLVVTSYSTKGCASTTRGLWSGGTTTPSDVITNTIQFITISTLGNTSDFGDLTAVTTQHQSSSNAVRGIFGGGMPTVNPSTCINVISYVTIASLGNAIDFGDLSRLSTRDGAGCSSSTRGIFAGGDPAAPPYSKVNIIDYITIMSTGNSVDFGDLLDDRNHVNACSNGHGGLG